MALTVEYWTGADLKTRQCYGWCVETASVSLTTSSASCGTVPKGATIARITAGEACYVSNNNVAASATNGAYLLAAGDYRDMAVPNGGGPFLARSVS